MLFCPKCKYEYNPGIEICPDCDEKLTYSLPREETEEKVEEGEEIEFDKEVELALLHTCSRLNAEIVKDILKNNGIPCLLKTSDLGGVFGGWYGGNFVDSTRIYISRDKLEEATKIVMGSDIDDSQG